MSAASPLRRAPRTTGTLAGAGAFALVLGTAGLPLPCPFLLITGLDCPFCGGSRMIGDLLRGDVPAAADHNAYALVVLIPAVVAVVVGMYRQELGLAARHWPSGAPGRLRSTALITTTVAWGVLRNLPGFEALRA
jgi:hypothetical protein